MNLRWTPEADRDLENIVRYIWRHDQAAARRMRDRIRTAVRRLEKLPSIGRPGELSGSRELVPHPSYRIVYEIADTIIVHAIVHTRRQWPPIVE